MNRTIQIDHSVSTSDLIIEEHQMYGGSRRCPSCGHALETRPDWVGLPAGVKFDPTDQELIEHLEAKVRSGDNSNKSHPLIDEFIPTIEGDDGICYTHPEKLPGVTRDGLSKHFFHRPSKAYTTGTRKRRKIQTDCDLQGGETRWHKTGKTRPVMVNGKQKGCKKILVLYTNFGKHRKPEKTNWVMHQYHLGEHEEEKDGELVVSKIFYQTQPRQCNWSERAAPPPAVAVAAGVGRRDSGGSGSSSCSKEINVAMREHHELSPVAGISGFGSSIDRISLQRNKGDNFSFAPFRRTFDEVDMGDHGTATMAAAPGAANVREISNNTCDDHVDIVDQERHSIASIARQNAVAAAAAVASSATTFHINRPCHPISGVLAPATLQQTIVNFDESYQRLLLQQQHQQEQHNHKLVGRTATGIEALFMGCPSTETSISNPPEADQWLKYQYWTDPDNPDHHG